MFTMTNRLVRLFKSRRERSAAVIRSAIGPMCDQLEGRKLFSVLTYTPAGNTVTVDGTSGNDAILMTQTAGPTINFYENGTLDASYGYPTYTKFVINGNAGDDSTSFDGSVDSTSWQFTINGNDGNDILTGSPGNDYFDGGAGNDSIYGGGGNDTIYGGNGSDVMRGGPGNDLVNGGNANGSADSGTNTGDYTGFASAVVLHLNSGTNNSSENPGDLDTITNLQTINGGNGNDIIDASAMTAAVSLLGNAGNDTLTGGSGNDTFVGGTGADVMIGGAGNDTADYSASTANLTISVDGIANDGAAGENDNVGQDIETILGGSGNDVIIASANVTPGPQWTFQTYLSGGGGDDAIYGSPGNDRIDGGDGNDLTFGGAGYDSITGGNGNDTLRGGPGSDTVDGGAGNNTADYSGFATPLHLTVNGPLRQGIGMISAENPGDSDYLTNLNTILGGNGDDYIGLYYNNTPSSVSGGAGNDTICGSMSNDTLDGGSGNDSIIGGGGNDSFIGGSGSDYMQGDVGNDTIQAADGEIDTITGGGGTDSIVYDTGMDILH